MSTGADTCRTLVLPKLYAAGWTDDHLAERRTYTRGRIIPRGQSGFRKPPRHADYGRQSDSDLRYTRDFFLAVVEAKQEYKHPSDDLQQAKEYAQDLDLKFAYSTNGHSVVEFDFLTGTTTPPLMNLKEVPQVSPELDREKAQRPELPWVNEKDDSNSEGVAGSREKHPPPRYPPLAARRTATHLTIIGITPERASPRQNPARSLRTPRSAIPQSVHWPRHCRRAIHHARFRATCRIKSPHRRCRTPSYPFPQENRPLRQGHHLLRRSGARLRHARRAQQSHPRSRPPVSRLDLPRHCRRSPYRQRPHPRLSR